MKKEEAIELIKHYVLNNFDNKWYPKPTFLEEHTDFFEFSINSKQYVESGDWTHSFIGLGLGYISKRHGEIVQYGSAPFKTREDFLKTEYKLNVVRTNYKIDRADYFYRVVINNITDEKKASKYINGIEIYSGGPTFKEMQDSKNNVLRSVNYFGLLNLLYFNIVDPFCDISFDKLMFKGHDDRPRRQFSSFNDHDSKDILFQNYMLAKVKQQYPTFEIHEYYTANLKETHGIDKLYQFLPLAGFSSYGYDDQTGFTGYIPHSYGELYEKIRAHKMSFEYVRGRDILFFLFLNTITPFCEISLKRIPSNLIKDIKEIM